MELQRPIRAPRGTLAIAVVAALLVPTGSSAGASPTWTLQPPANPGGIRGDFLYGVSCTSASACTGVGTYRDTMAHKLTLAERWDGTSWSAQTTPSPTQTGNQFLSVSCVAKVCMAVGNSRVNAQATYLPLAARRTGSRWAVQQTVNPGGSNGGQFYGVSCTQPKACTAVGYYYLDSAGAFATLVERWDGVSWTTQATPTFPGAFLNWVSCSTRRSCMAVGATYDRFGVASPIAERWDGNTWQIEQMPIPAGSQGMNAQPTVSCSSDTACTAVWAYLDEAGTWMPIAERWDGTAWTIQSTPTPEGATLTYLYSVSCDEPDSCEAVGFYRDSGSVDVTLTMHWDGSSWAIEPSPTPAGPGPAFLGDVSCTAGGLCTAVGSYRDAAGTDLALAEVRR